MRIYIYNRGYQAQNESESESRNRKGNEKVLGFSFGDKEIEGARDDRQPRHELQKLSKRRQTIDPELIRLRVTVLSYQPQTTPFSSPTQHATETQAPSAAVASSSGWSWGKRIRIASAGEFTSRNGWGGHASPPPSRRSHTLATSLLTCFPNAPNSLLLLLLYVERPLLRPHFPALGERGVWGLFGGVGISRASGGESTRFEMGAEKPVHQYHANKPQLESLLIGAPASQK